MKIIYFTILNSYLLYGDPAMLLVAGMLMFGMTLAWKTITTVLGI